MGRTIYGECRECSAYLSGIYRYLGVCQSCNRKSRDTRRGEGQ